MNTHGEREGNKHHRLLDGRGWEEDKDWKTTYWVLCFWNVCMFVPDLT